MARSVLMIAGATYTDPFVCALAKQLKDKADYRFSALGMNQHGGREITAPPGLFERIDPFPDPKTRPDGCRQRLAFVRDLLLAPAPPAAPVDPTNSWRGTPQVRRTVKARVVRRLARAYFARWMPSLAAGYDIHHWHTLDPGRLAALNYLPRNAKVVLSVWGSDLLRTAGVQQYEDQLWACQKADIITVTSLEMQEILLAKFGRGLYNKVRHVLLGNILLDAVDRHRDARGAFTARHRISSDRAIVCVGHNSSAANRHLEILDRMAALDARYRSRIAAVLPMTYPPIPEYVARVRAAAEKCPFEVRILDQHLTDDEVGELRCSSDVLVHTPISDAFCAAMTETLYAGGTLITGAWLPYSRLRGSHVHYHEVQDVSEVTARLSDVLEHLADEKRLAAENRCKIHRLVAPEHTADAWLRVYDELLASASDERR